MCETFSTEDQAANVTQQVYKRNSQRGKPKRKSRQQLTVQRLAQVTNTNKDVMSSLLAVICSIFGRRPVPNGDTQTNTLPALSLIDPRISEVLQWHNQNSLDVLVQYGRTMVKTGVLDDHDGAPISLQLPCS